MFAVDAVLQWLHHPTHPAVLWILLAVGVGLVGLVRVYDGQR